MPSYTTLQSVRTQGIVVAADEDTKLANLIPVCSRILDVMFGQNFDIRAKADYFSGEVNGATLDLRDKPLLSVTTLLNGDETAITSDKYVLLPRGAYPKTKIRLTLGNYWVPPTNTNWRQVPVAYAEDAIAVTGEWGYVPHYTTAWTDSEADVGAGGVNASVKSLPVNPAGKLDVGHIIRIGTEQLRVTGPVASTSAATSLSVERGYNGTTAAAHAEGAQIDLFTVDELIELAAAEFVLSVYESRQSKTGRQMNASGFGSVTMADIPDKVWDKAVAPWWNWQYGQIRITR